MTDHSNDRVVDPFDTLRTHVRAVALLERPTVDPDELVERITGGIDRADRSRAAQVVPLRGLPGTRSPRRRRWLAVAATATIVAVGGAGVAAYVASRPIDPVLGIVCRESTELGSRSVVLPLDQDPVAACTNMWRAGDLGDDTPPGSVPDLLACTGVNGAVEVLPARATDSCVDLGMVALEAPGSRSEVIAVLRERLAQRLSSGCESAQELRRFVEGQLTALELRGWAVRLETPAAECALASIDSAVDQVVIIEDPLASPSPQETP